MHNHGLQTRSFLWNDLVLMLVDAVRLHDGLTISINKLLNLNGSSTWNSLIMDFVKCGKLQSALTLYERMQEDVTVHPCIHTYVALLKACARLKNLQTGLVIHYKVAITGQELKNLCVGSVLVNMYAECGSLAGAQQVFDGLQVRNAVSWNALITAYVRHGYGEEAIKAFSQMQESGVIPSSMTYIGVLKACGSAGFVIKGQDIHAELERNGILGKDVFVGNTLVDMYAKCCLLAKAQEVFDRLAKPNVVSWNALISGYAEQERNEEVLHIFEQMQAQKFSPDAITLICSLKACGNIGEAHMGEGIHAEIERKGWLEKDCFIGNALVGMYAKCGMVFKAQQVFDKLLARDVIAWNALITGYVEHGLDEEALDCLQQMQSEDVSPDSVTYIGGLRACGSIEALEEGQELHVEIERKRLVVKNHFLGSALVDMYAKCGSLIKSHEVFERLPTRNVVAWTALISGYAEHGDGEQALKYFEQMQCAGVPANAFTYVGVLRACGSIGAAKIGRSIHEEIERIGLLESNVIVGSTLVDMYTKCGLISRARQVFDLLPRQDAIAWTSLAAAYAENGQAEEALIMLEQMQIAGIPSDEIALLCCLKVCGSIGATNKGAVIHADLARKGLLEGVVIGNMLVDMYSKCGSISLAQQVFDRLSFQDVACWNSLIAGYAYNEDGTQVFEMFSKMLRVGLCPDPVTFLIILNVCASIGFVAEGQAYFEAMKGLYGITPTVEHYNCMVDILCRAGYINNALALVKNKAFADIVTRRSILGACKRWGFVEGGSRAFGTRFEE